MADGSIPDDVWLNRRYYGGDLPAEAERALHQAGLAWADEISAEGHIREALALAPDHLAPRLGAYKFYFYRHRLADALPHAEACLAHAARRLGVGDDWRAVTAEQADFAEIDGDARFYLFSLMACGYLAVRLGRRDEGEVILSKVAALDPKDRLGAASLLAHLAKGGNDDEDEE
ncbi:MAG TPA: hypothetical protein VM661_12705 [Candidatus Sulfotelmatobacter sp.]|jgi:hypothetical protein|nr:hypothetical protein [Candidatus Sulfotelmatobacter sp.]